MSPIQIGRVHFADEHDDHIVKAWFAETLPVVDDGYGGWETVDRPHRKQALNWKGRPRATMTLAIVLNGFATGSKVLVPTPGTYGHKVKHINVRQDESVEADIRQLEKFAQPQLNKHNVIVGPPLPIKVNGGGALPHDLDNASHLRWVISEITWGQALWSDNGDRIRQEATLNMYEWDLAEDNEGDEIGLNPLKKKSKSTDKNFINVKTGKHDTLKTLAKKYLHNTHLWRRIRTLNPRYNDPNATLPAHKSIKIPKHK